MPNAKGRFLGISVPGDAWERIFGEPEPEHEHDPHGICKRRARFPINEPPYCSCVGGACRKGA